MSSRFKKSLGLFKCRQAEDVYRILKEKEFEEKYVEIPPAVYLRDKDISKMHRGEISALIALESFFMNLYAALRFGFEIDGILDQMEYEGISFENAEALLLKSRTSLHPRQERKDCRLWAGRLRQLSDPVYDG